MTNTIKAIELSGKTYAAREYIKQFGGTWHAATKTWTMSQEQYDAMCAKCTPTYSRRAANAIDDCTVREIDLAAE